MSGILVNPQSTPHLHLEGDTIPYSELYGKGTIFVCQCQTVMKRVNGPAWKFISHRRFARLLAKTDLTKPTVTVAWKKGDDV